MTEFFNPSIFQPLNPSILQSLNPSILYLLPYLTLIRLARNTPNLSSAPAVRGPPISVIIPARNEEATIATVVESVLASDYRPLEVLVVDDRSTDRTGAIVSEIAQRDARLRLIPGEPLPEGWFGKPWACDQGYHAARGEILVFTDADTRHEPGLLAHALGDMEKEGAHLLTVSPHQRCETFWERLVMPQVWWLLAVRYHPRSVNRARRARDVIANGQFIMVPRADYEAVGTHAVVREEVAEDLALAQAFFRAGRKLRFVFAQRLMETRMYRDLPHLVEGWSKNLYLGGRLSFPDEPLARALVPLLVALPLILWVLPPLAWLGGAAGWFQPSLTAAAATATVLSAVFWAIISVSMRIPPWYALGYPLGAGMALFIVARSTVRGGEVEWKGRRYGN